MGFDVAGGDQLAELAEWSSLGSRGLGQIIMGLSKHIRTHGEL